jgi:hypothetical protein
MSATVRAREAARLQRDGARARKKTSERESRQTQNTRACRESERETRSQGEKENKTERAEINYTHCGNWDRERRLP